MLTEIYMLRLEAAARTAKEATTSDINMSQPWRCFNLRWLGWQVVLGSVRVGDLEPTETSGLAGNWQIAFLEEAEPRRPRYSAVPKAQSQVSAGTRPTTAAAR